MVYIKEKGIVYTIYETESEFIASEHNHLLKPLEEAEDGDYILCNNGVYVPIVQKGNIHRTTVTVKGVKRLRKTPIDFWYYRMPACTRFVYKGRFEQGFNWERKYYRVGTNLTPQERAFIKLIEEGAAIIPAAKSVWGKYYLDRFYKLFNREHVFKEIAKRVNKMNLKDELKSQGITEKVIAEELAGLLKGDNVTGKKYAIEKLLELMSVQESPQISEPQNEVLSATEQLSAQYSNN